MEIQLLDLERVDASQRAVFGGKACGLGALIAAGARVPRGFAISATALAPDRWGAEARDALCSQLRFLLRDGPIAVRSSAVDEDGSEHSFAGLFESVLGVQTEQQALEATARCIASGASERVLTYAGCEEALPVGVVVQRMVDAQASGVLFTRDPAGRARGMVLEAVEGLGEALVSGHVTPVRWRLHHSGRGVLEAHPEAGAEAGPISGLAALQLGSSAKWLSVCLGMPLDLEWTRDARGVTWFVQARPITQAVPPPPLPRVEASCPEANDGPVTVWTNVNVRETMPDPLTPLAWSMWRDRMMPAAVGLSLDLDPADPASRELVLADRVDGRVYWNVNAMLATPGAGALTRRLLEIIDGAAKPAFDALLANGVLTPRRLSLSRAALLAAAVRASLKGLPHLIAALRPEQSLERFREVTAEVQRRAESSLAGRSDTALADELSEVTSPGFLRVRALFTSLFLAIGSFTLARHVFRNDVAAQRLLGVGILNNPTTRMSVDLDALTEAARPLAAAFLGDCSAEALFERLDTTPEGRDWMTRLAEFLAWNGQRCPKEFDLLEPRWSDDPRMLLGIVRANLHATPKEPVADRLERLCEERQRAIREAVRAAPRWKRPLMRRVARLAERHLPLREGGKHHILSAFHRARTLSVELGARLAARGDLDAADDVFFLDFAELGAAARGEADAANLRAKVEQRRAELAAAPDSTPPAFVRSDGVPVPCGALEPTEDGVLRGVGISTGAVQGTVRILERPDPEAFGEGEILVVRLADPGWTPLFPRAGGLVMEVGGLMCHAAVVARELGLPAVFGVAGARSALRNGQHVRIDADAGTVTPL